MDSNRKRQEITIPPIRASGKRGQLTYSDAAVVIGGSTPDIVNTPQSSVQESTSSVQAAEGRKMVSKGRKTVSKGRKTVSKGKNKRSRRVAFVPNKVSKMKLIAWKRRYGSKFHVFINMAIEKFEP